ncbi:MAG: hypothetical protein A3F09_00300 [Chlamydiae bacterium RIFCSPHIGHO2_12_FULL_49_11]|nr:MAG: hypothetical protein A3F09_00300 [Chlamydiae bacterium RIFCSPHIGHO2_12_FULL_49_11]
MIFRKLVALFLLPLWSYFASPAIRFSPVENGPLLRSLPPRYAHLQMEARQVTGDFAEEGRTDRIYVLKEGDTPVFILKTLDMKKEDEKRDYYQEKRAFEVVQSKHFHRFRTPRLAYIGVKENTGMLIETPAAGKSLVWWLQDRTPEGREALKDAVEEAAIALAELHTSHKFSTPAPYYQKLYPASSLPGPYGLIHGDVHPGNIFFDGKSITFIDLSSLYPSLNGAPVALDVAHFTLMLRAFAGYYGVPKKEVELLVTQFLTTYRKHGYALSDKLIESYMKLIAHEYASYLAEGIGSQDHQILYVKRFMTSSGLANS